MRTETTRLFKDLLDLNGYVLQAPDADPEPRVDLATEAATHPLGTPLWESSMNLFKSLWLLGGLQSIDSRIGDDEEPSFGPSYGNRLASERAFGPSRDKRGAPGPNAKHARNDAHEQRAAHC